MVHPLHAYSITRGLLPSDALTCGDSHEYLWKLTNYVSTVMIEDVIFLVITAYLLFPTIYQLDDMSKVLPVLIFQLADFEYLYSKTKSFISKSIYESILDLT